MVYVAQDRDEWLVLVEVSNLRVLLHVSLDIVCVSQPRLHGVTTQKTTIGMLTAVRTSKPMQLCRLCVGLYQPHERESQSGCRSSLLKVAGLEPVARDVPSWIRLAPRHATSRHSSALRGAQL
jgi:hypothetical protein